MRKFSILIVMLAIIFIPNIVSANQSISTNIKTNLKLFKTKNNIIYFNNTPIACKITLKTKETPIIPKTERDILLTKRWKNKQSYRWSKLSPKKFTINASAYTAAADECGKSDGITASGLKVKEKRTLACPSIYPFGAKIKIEGYGIYTCEDRGGAIKGNRFDIYMKTKSEAFAFGRRHLIAEIIL